MIGLAWLLFREAKQRVTAPAAVRNGPPPFRPTGGPAPGGVVTVLGEPHPRCPQGTPRKITATSGGTYEFCAHGLRGQQVLSGIGAFFAGVMSTGVGEATMPGLIRRSHFPAAIAAATSIVVVAGTVIGAALTHMAQLAADSGIQATPWDLIVWAVPAAIVGAFIGTALQGKISAKATRWFFGILFPAIGLTFLVAFTVFVNRFG